MALAMAGATAIMGVSPAPDQARSGRSTKGWSARLIQAGRRCRHAPSPDHQSHERSDHSARCRGLQGRAPWRRDARSAGSRDDGELIDMTETMMAEYSGIPQVHADLAIRGRFPGRPGGWTRPARLRLSVSDLRAQRVEPCARLQPARSSCRFRTGLDRPYLAPPVDAFHLNDRYRSSRIAGTRRMLSSWRCDLVPSVYSEWYLAPASAAGPPWSSLCRRSSPGGRHYGDLGGHVGV